jgi:hypothetical protein
LHVYYCRIAKDNIFIGNMTSELEFEISAESALYLWLLIHGGDPGPGDVVSIDDAKQAAIQIVQALVPYLEGKITQQSVEELKKLATKAPPNGASAKQLIERLNNLGVKVHGREGETGPENLEIAIRPGGPFPPGAKGYRLFCFKRGKVESCWWVPYIPGTPPFPGSLTTETDRFQALTHLESPKGPLVAEQAPNFWTCARECEVNFAALATVANGYFREAVGQSNPDLVISLADEGRALADKAARALRTCLASCPSPPPLNIWIDSQGHVKPFSLRDFESAIFRRYLLYPEETA